MYGLKKNENLFEKNNNMWDLMISIKYSSTLHAFLITSNESYISIIFLMILLFIRAYNFEREYSIHILGDCLKFLKSQI